MNRKIKLEARLEVDPLADTVVGTITGGDGVERPFSGWMELASAIETWRAENSPDTRETTTQTADRRPPDR